MSDEVLFNLVQVLEDDWPAGPSFLHALTALIESAVIHERIYRDPIYAFTDNQIVPGRVSAASRVDQSQLLLDLKASGLFLPSPAMADLNLALAQAKFLSPYDAVDFMGDVVYTPVGFSFADPRGEISAIRVRQELVANPMMIRCREFFTLKYEDPETYAQWLKIGLASSEDVDGPDRSIVQKMMADFRMTEDDMITLSSFNRRAQAYLELSRRLNLNPVMPYLANVHLIGGVGLINSKARVILDKINAKFDSMEAMDGSQGNFSYLNVPPLTRTVLQRCKDSRSLLINEIVNIRKEHSALRKSLTEFDQNWMEAQTIADRQRLKSSFDNALTRIEEKVVKPKKRILYRLASPLAEPLKLPAAAVKWLSDKGHDLSVRHKIRGMPKLFDKAMKAPVDEAVPGMIQRMNIQMMPEEVWVEAKRLDRQCELAMSITANG
ncbi:MAG: hypothetical protein AAFX76_07400 [Planctomycetota bacterium]